MTCQVCSQSPVSHKSALVQKYMDYCPDSDLLELQFSTPNTDPGFSHSQQSTEDKDMKHGIFSKCCDVDRQTVLDFFKCQVINYLYKGSDHQLQRDVPGVSH